MYLKAQNKTLLQSVVSLIFMIFVLNLGFTSMAQAQSQDEKLARAYYFESERAVNIESYSDALLAINKAEELLGKGNASTTAIKVKIYFGQQKYNLAKQALNKFYTYEAGDKLSREMSTYLIRIDKKVEGENIRIAAQRQAQIEKAERDRLAAISAEKRRILANRVRQENIEKERLATQSKHLGALLKAHQDQIERCEKYAKYHQESESCVEVGRRFEYGDLVAQDYEKAVYFYRAACHGYNEVPLESDHGYSDSYVDINACLGRIRMLDHGYAVSEHPEVEAFNILVGQRCDREIPSVCNKVGLFWQHGVFYSDGKLYRKSDSKRARNLFTTSCDAGNAQGCAALNFLQPDTNERYLSYLDACWGEDKDACYQVAQLSAADPKLEEHTDINNMGSDSFYIKACGLDSMEACYEYANIKSKNLFGEYYFPNEKVVAFFQKVCTSIQPKDACSKLESVKAEILAKADVFEAECVKGEGKLCAEVGDWFNEGVIVPVDYTRAGINYRIACDSGWDYSCKVYAVMAENGKGMAVSLDTTAKYYTLACQDNMADEDACINAYRFISAGHGSKEDKSKLKKAVKNTKGYLKYYCKQQKKEGGSGSSSYCQRYKKIKALK
ncbi:MAG: TPR repeat protein [Flavobacteriales bacterium]|jgi:TPR repeat protein